MTIKIGGHDLAITTSPKDLDATLIAATGCNSAEIDHLLAAGPARAAAALRPFLKDGDALPGGELANAIAGDRGAIEVIRGLYANLNAEPTKAEPAKVDGK